MTSGNHHKLPLPLEGIRVLDATHIVAGPFCSQILADMGAEVIKIERPGSGDNARERGPFIEYPGGQRISSRYLGINRNKKSVTVDLRDPRCKRAFENMVKVSHVLLDNWGPGAFNRLGLGYDHLRAINPGLVYATITGYGDSNAAGRGPYSNWPANNLSIQGMSGWMELTGDPDGAPQSVGDNVGDSVPGLWTALGIVLALETRRRTGQGQHVDMSMYECMVSHMISNMNAYQAKGENPGRSWDRLATAGLAFKAKDGYVLMAGVRAAAAAARWKTLWIMMGRQDLSEDKRYLGGASGEFFRDNIIPAIEAWSRDLSKWDVAAKFTEIGFSMGVAQTIADLAQCPHLEARQMFVETGDTLGGRFKSVKTPIRLTGCLESRADTPPTLGENTRELLISLGGLTGEEVDRMEEEKVV
ncbi:MAG: CoA transferase [SAR202 cluster bacterium]|nr:CoA transferase [SAR202 cluster bacterium]